MAALSEAPIFFPLDRKGAYGFEGAMRVVRKAVFDGVDGAVALAARTFLEFLGVCRPDPAEVIERSLLPLFKWRLLSGTADATEGILVGATLFVKEHLAEYEKRDSRLVRLKDELLLKATPDGQFFKAVELYLPASYGNANDLETLFEGLGGFYFVSGDYLEASLKRLPRRAGEVPSDAQRRREVKAWKEFLLRLGVEERPRVTVLPPTATAPARAWSDDFQRVFATGQWDRIFRAFVLIDRWWSEYRKLLSVSARRKTGVGQTLPADVPSEFRQQLVTAEWMPVKGHRLARPADTFLDTPDTRQLLGDHVPYLDAPFRNRHLLDDLGIRREPDTAAALLRLNALAEQEACDFDVLAHLYGFLAQRFATHGEAIAAAFVNWPLICVPGQPACYLHSGEVFWEEVSPAFTEYRGNLKHHWPGLETFFIHGLGVRPSPSAEDYGRLLRRLVSHGEPTKSLRSYCGPCTRDSEPPWPERV